MLSIRDALQQMLPAFRTLGSERVPLTAAASTAGRVLASELRAPYDLPELDNSAMDGYALRYADLSGPGCTLPVQSESRAGGGIPETLKPGHAMRIFTGAPLPAGADTIVMQEDTAREGERVVVRELPKARGAFVRARGSDLKTGAVALAAGTSLGPGEIGLLAGLDVVEVDVFRRPRVAVLATGDELRELGEPARPGSIVNSNAHLLAALIRAAGAEPHVLPIARDVPEDIAARVREGLQHDVLLTIGGVSVGDYDFVERALRSEGVELAFHKVAIKPGKPILFGTHGARGVPVVGLPGNPVSVMVTFEVFVRPGLLRMAGHAAPYPWPIGVELAEAYEHGHARTELARARLERRGERMIAHLHARQGSGSLPSMTGADVLVILPRNSGRFAAGARVWAIRLGDAPRSSEPPFDD